MLLNGKKPKHNIKVLVLPRENGDDLIFKAGAVSDMTPFEQLCPAPTPPTKTVRGGEVVPDYEDKTWPILVSQQSDRRWDWIILQSLKATPDLVWETVKETEPDTWANWRREAVDSGMSAFEINRIIATVVDANSLNETTLEEARKTFLAGQAQA